MIATNLLQMEGDQRACRAAEKLMEEDEGLRVGWIDYEGRRPLEQVVHGEQIFICLGSAEGERVEADITRLGGYVGRGNSRQEAMEDLLRKLRRKWEARELRRLRHERKQALAQVEAAVQDVLEEQLGGEAVEGISVTATAYYPGDDDELAPVPDEPLPPYTPPSYHLDQELEA